jgi:hypothetical protein
LNQAANGEVVSVHSVSKAFVEVALVFFVAQAAPKIEREMWLAQRLEVWTVLLSLW